MTLQKKHLASSIYNAGKFAVSGDAVVVEDVNYYLAKDTSVSVVVTRHFEDFFKNFFSPRIESGFITSQNGNTIDITAGAATASGRWIQTTGVENFDPATVGLADATYFIVVSVDNIAEDDVNLRQPSLDSISFEVILAGAYDAEVHLVLGEMDVAGGVITGYTDFGALRTEHIDNIVPKNGATIRIYTGTYPNRMIAGEFTSQKFNLLNGTDINEFSIDGTLVGNSDDAVPTEQAVKTYVDTELAAFTTDHGTLVGLGDDDHTQYLLIDGTRAMTGELQMTDDNKIQFSSSITNHAYAEYISTTGVYELGYNNGARIWMRSADTRIRSFPLHTDAGLTVNAVDLTLATGVKITSADEDLDFTFGRALIDSRATDITYFSHRDMTTINNYAFAQTSVGASYINSVAQTSFQINGATKMTLDTNSLDLASGIDLSVGGDITVVGKSGGSQSNNITMDRLLTSDSLQLKFSTLAVTNYTLGILGGGGTDFTLSTDGTYGNRIFTANSTVMALEGNLTLSSGEISVGNYTLVTDTLLSSTYWRAGTGAGGDVFFDYGGIFYFRDKDNANANMASVDSSNGNIQTVGNVTLGTLGAHNILQLNTSNYAFTIGQSDSTEHYHSSDTDIDMITRSGADRTIYMYSSNASFVTHLNVSGNIVAKEGINITGNLTIGSGWTSAGSGAYWRYNSSATDHITIAMDSNVAIKGFSIYQNATPLSNIFHLMDSGGSSHLTVDKDGLLTVAKVATFSAGLDVTGESKFYDVVKIYNTNDVSERLTFIGTADGVFRIYNVDETGSVYQDLNIGHGTAGVAGSLFYDASAGRWGVGDATPTYTWDVNGTFRAVGNADFDAGIDVTGTAYFGGGTTYYFGSAGDVNALTITANSSLDVIGTTTLDGNVYIDTSTGGTKFYVTRLGTSGQSLSMWVTDDTSWIATTQDETTGEYGNMAFRLDDGGTTTPYYLFDVATGVQILKMYETQVTFTPNVDFGAGIDVTGDQTISGNILKDVTSGFLGLSGDSAIGSGGNILLYGSAHSTLAYDTKIRAGSTAWLHYDNSATTLNIVAPTVDITGNLTITGTVDGVNIGDNYANWNTAYTHSQVVTGNPHALSVDDLLDVDTTTSPPSLNDSLIWDGATWSPNDIGSIFSPILHGHSAADIITGSVEDSLAHLSSAWYRLMAGNASDEMNAEIHLYDTFDGRSTMTILISGKPDLSSIGWSGTITILNHHEKDGIDYATHRIKGLRVQIVDGVSFTLDVELQNRNSTSGNKWAYEAFNYGGSANFTDFTAGTINGAATLYTFDTDVINAAYTIVDNNDSQTMLWGNKMSTLVTYSSKNKATVGTIWNDNLPTGFTESSISGEYYSAIDRFDNKSSHSIGKFMRTNGDAEYFDTWINAGDTSYNSYIDVSQELIFRTAFSEKMRVVSGGVNVTGALTATSTIEAGYGTGETIKLTGAATSYLTATSELIIRVNDDSAFPKNALTISNAGLIAMPFHVDVTGGLNVVSGGLNVNNALGSYDLHVQGATANVFGLYRPISSGNSQVGMSFDMQSSDSSVYTYAKIDANIVLQTLGVEDGELRFFVSDGGSLIERLSLTNEQIKFSGDVRVHQIDTVNYGSLRFETDYVANEESSRIFFSEETVGDRYGISLIYAGTANPTFDTTTFTLATDTFYEIAHQLSDTGTIVRQIARATGITTFNTATYFGATVDITGALTVGSTVDGRDIAVDGTKLDGIATNANLYVLPFVDNSANWNTAYGWGDHSLGGYLTTLGSVTGHTDVTSAGSGIIISAAERTALHAIYVLPFTDNSTNWNTAYGWGNHSGLYELSGAIATHTAISSAHHTKYDSSDFASDLAPFTITGNVFSGGISDSTIRTRHLHGKQSITDAVDTLFINYSAVGFGVQIGDTGTDHPLSVFGNITVAGTVDGRDIATDGTKLDTITNVGSGVIISSAERTALHAIYTHPTSITGMTNISMTGVDDRVKYNMWSSGNYGIGMGSGYTFGSVSDFVMTFNMNDQATRGWWFGDDVHTNAQGAMSLSTDGYMTLANGLRVGYGESDTTKASVGLQVSGDISTTGFIKVTGGVPSTPSAGTVHIGRSTDDRVWIQNDHGYINIGCANSSWAHYYTDRAGNYFDKKIESAGNIKATSMTTTGTLTVDGIATFTNGLGFNINKASASNYGVIGQTAGSWAFLRLQGDLNSTYRWDIAVKSTDNSGALQFRPLGAATNAMLLSTAGDLTIQGNLDIDNGHGLQIYDSTDVYRLTLNFSGTSYGRIYAYSGGRNDLNFGGTSAGADGSLYYDASARRWGIADSTPSYVLDVNGTLRCYGFTNSSDERLKKNVYDLAEVDVISLLRPVEFEWKQGCDGEFDSCTNDEHDALKEDRPYGKQFGFIAQEVEKVSPELVSTDRRGYKSIDTLEIIPHLVKKLQTQSKIIDDILARLDVLENYEVTNI